MTALTVPAAVSMTTSETTVSVTISVIVPVRRLRMLLVGTIL